jgi:hypothetical protein
MKNILLFIRLLVVLCVNVGVFAQSDGCSGTIPTLAVATSCSPTNFTVASSFTDDFSTEPSCATDYKDGFFQFTATSTATTITMTDGSAGPNPGFMLLTGSCGGGFTEIACEETGNGNTETVNITTVIGQVYYIVIFRANNVGTNDMSGTICVQDYNSTVVSASDCDIAVNVCTNIGFQIDPNGNGTVDEIPPLGSLGNPDYLGDNPFGPSSNDGCLRVGETNSTWMVVNVLTAGSLEFTFGGGGAQAGYYDWIMYPYSGPSTCSDIPNNTLAPVSCNWNWASSGGTGLASTIPSGGDPGNFESPLTVAANSQYVICFSNYSSSSTTVPLDFGGTAQVSCSPLGVSLVSFNAETLCEEGVVNMIWKTTNEVNFDYFEVQRSTSGYSWDVLGKVKEPTNIVETLKTYNYRSPIASEEIVYYRLKMVDYDGKFSYSEIKGVNCANRIKLNRLIPNPSSEITSFMYKSETEGKLMIFDQLGRLCKTIILESSDFKIIQKTIDVSTLDSGVYQFIISIDGKQENVKFVKL